MLSEAHEREDKRAVRARESCQSAKLDGTEAAFPRTMPPTGAPNGDTPQELRSYEEVHGAVPRVAPLDGHGLAQQTCSATVVPLGATAQARAPTAEELATLDAETDALRAELAEVQALAADVRGAVGGSTLKELSASAKANMSELAEERWRLETYAELEALKNELLRRAGVPEALNAAAFGDDVDDESAPEGGTTQAGAGSSTATAAGPSSALGGGAASETTAEVDAANAKAQQLTAAEELSDGDVDQTLLLMAEMDAQFDLLQRQLEQARLDRDELTKLKACLQTDLDSATERARDAVQAAEDAHEENQAPPNR